MTQGPMSLNSLLNPRPAHPSPKAPANLQAPPPSAATLDQLPKKTPPDCFSFQPLARRYAPYRAMCPNPAEPREVTSQAGPSTTQPGHGRNNLAHLHRAFGHGATSSETTSLGLTLGPSAATSTAQVESLSQQPIHDAFVADLYNAVGLPLSDYRFPAPAAAPKTPRPALERWCDSVSPRTPAPRGWGTQAHQASPQGPLRRSDRLLASGGSARAEQRLLPAYDAHVTRATRGVERQQSAARMPFVPRSGASLQHVTSVRPAAVPAEHIIDRLQTVTDWIARHRNTFVGLGFTENQIEALGCSTRPSSRVSLMMAISPLTAAGFTADDIIATVRTPGVAEFIPELRRQVQMFRGRGYSPQQVTGFLRPPDTRRRILAFAACEFNFTDASDAVRQQILGLYAYLPRLE